MPTKRSKEVIILRRQISQQQCEIKRLVELVKKYSSAADYLRASNATLMRMAKELLGFETWPKIKGDFVQGVARLMKLGLKRKGHPTHRCIPYKVWKAIEGERRYQDQKWSGHRHVLAEWIIIIAHLVAKCRQAWFYGHGNDDQALHELRQVAATAVAAMEQCGALPRKLQEPFPVLRCAPSRIHDFDQPGEVTRKGVMVHTPVVSRQDSMNSVDENFTARRKRKKSALKKSRKK